MERLTPVQLTVSSGLHYCTTCRAMPFVKVEGLELSAGAGPGRQVSHSLISNHAFVSSLSLMKINLQSVAHYQPW